MGREKICSKNSSRVLLNCLISIIIQIFLLMYGLLKIS